jgi:hypothetical protein
MTELTGVLQVDKVDQEELHLVLLAHFGSMPGGSISESLYARPGQGPALIVRYDGDGKLTSIEPGAAVAADDVGILAETVQRTLLDEARPAFARFMLFATQPLTGWFRYGDRFQLVPAPPQAPRPRHGPGGEPLLLEYAFRGCSNRQVEFRRSVLMRRELELLCTSLIPNIDGGVGHLGRHMWCEVGQLETPPTQRSEYCQEGYAWDGSGAAMSGFSAVNNLEPVTRVPAQDYYNDLSIKVGRPLAIPDSIERHLDDYFALEPPDHERFMRACFWCQHAQRQWETSYSGAYTALVSAVEALVPPSIGGERCVACSKTLGPGPTQLFKAFVEEHAPGGITASRRGELYALRSALSHGGKLLHIDEVGFLGGNRSEIWRQRRKHQEMWALVRVILVNWLSSRGAVSQAS